MSDFADIYDVERAAADAERNACNYTDREVARLRDEVDELRDRVARLEESVLDLREQVAAALVTRGTLG